MVYNLHPRIKTFFEGFINSAFENHEKSDAWVKEIINQDWRHHSTLIDRGQSSFAKEVAGLSPRDQVIVYCYYYMQMHAVSTYIVYSNAWQNWSMRFSKNLVFIDFGCGPLTSAIAMAWYKLAHNINKAEAAKKGLRFHYIGIDRSSAMLEFAQEVWDGAGNLFHADSTCDLITRTDAPAELPKLVGKYRDGGKLTICLNCSYYFASTSLSVPALIKLITDVLSTVSDDRVCLVYQNADNRSKNEKWVQFKAGMKDSLFPCYSDVCEEITYADVTGKRLQPSYPPIKLRHAILLNQTWKDELETE